MTIETTRIQTYLVRSSLVSRRHRHRVSAYLVHRFTDSVVVARIEPLGLVRASHGDHELTLQGLRRDLRITGPWRVTSSHRHTSALLGPVAPGRNDATAPQNH